MLLRGNSRCEKHQNVNRQLHDQNRESASKRGYGHKWRKARETFLAIEENSYCAHCGADGVLAVELVVDHIVPHRGDKSLFWNRRNWQALCKSCHNKKTAREDGGFGRTGGGKKSGSTGL